MLKAMRIEIVEFESKGRGAYDVTPLIREKVKECLEGLAIVSVLSPLTSIITIEYEPALLSDLERLLEKIPSKNSFIKNSVFSKSLVIPIIEGEPELGSFQQIVLLDLNSDKGTRKIAVGVIKQ